MIRHLPNLLTFSRLPIAVAIFVMLSLLNLNRPGATTILHLAAMLFVLAMMTDVFDGLLARRLNVCSQMGRMADALLDKVLVCGTFVFFISNRFEAVGALGQEPVNISGIQPWMLVLIVVRELVVTGLRTTSESQGRAFSATIFGKLKFSLQSVTIIYLLVYAANGWYGSGAATAIRDMLIWPMVIFTGLSAVAYVGRAARIARKATIPAIVELEDPPPPTESSAVAEKIDG